MFVGFRKDVVTEVVEMLKLTKDCARGLNATIWGGVEGAEKVGKIVKTGASVTDVAIGTIQAVDDFQCGDIICGTIDVIGCISSAVGITLGNIPSTKKYTTVTTSVTVCCRSIRLYCKNYGSFWHCVTVSGDLVKKGVKFVIKKKSNSDL